MAHALLVPIPADLQPEQVRDDLTRLIHREREGTLMHDDWKRWGEIQQAMNSAQIVELPDGHSGPYAAVGPIPAPVVYMPTGGA